MIVSLMLARAELLADSEDALSEAVVSASSKKCLRGIQIGFVVTRIFRDELGVHGAMEADRIMGRDPIWGKLRIRDNRERFFEE